jgi:ParB family chromosome partitioning protein
MQSNRAFQFLAVDTIHESAFNPRQTFEESKLHELAESIRQHGLIQPITVRPDAGGFEIVAGARRFRAAQLAELFSLPARIVELTDGQAVEWSLIENAQRIDVHPYEEAQGFQRLLDMPGYDVAALAEKTGKSPSHVYARLSLLQLIPEVAEAFTAERITASHANLIARLPQEHQAAAFEQCWRKDWQDAEPHLLSAKHLSAWIQSNLFLALADAPFDREDPTLNPVAGACVTCPRRSGYNTSLFSDVASQGDHCLDAQCFHSKIAGHIDREIAARPEMVQIETAWRHPKEQRPGALQKHQYRELPQPENPDAEPSCASTRTALIVFGRHIGKTLTVCTEVECPIHNPLEAARRIPKAAPITAASPIDETDVEAEQESVEHKRQLKEYEAEQERKAEERRQEFEREEQEYEAEQERRGEVRKAREATFERIVAHAPATFTAAQFRVFLRALLCLDLETLIDDLAAHYAGDNEDDQRYSEEVLLTTIDGLADDQLTGFALRLALTGHMGLVPREGDIDFLAEVEAALVLPKPREPAATGKTKTQTGVAPATTPKKKAAKKRVAA